MLDDDKVKAQKIEREVRWWAYAGWTMPFVVLAVLFFLGAFGWTDLYDKVIVVVAVIFFSIAVFWWWWAIFKIQTIAGLMSNAADKFKQLQKELAKFKTDFKE